MEIRDYLRAIRRRLWLLIIPVLAGGATAGLLATQANQYTAEATVIVPSLSAKGYSTSAVTAYASAYKDVLVSKPVVDQVVAKTHAKTTEVQKCASAVATASSNILIVTCQSTDKSIVAPMTAEAAVDALDALVGPQLSKAKDEVNTAQTALNKANADLTAFQQSSGTVDPSKDYALQSTELQQLITQEQQAEIANDTARSATLKGIISDRQKTVATLGAQVIQATDLKDNKTVALGSLQRASQDLESVNSTIASNHAAGSVTTADNGHISKVGPVLRFAAIAFAIAMLLVLGLIVVLELTRPRKRPVTAAVTTAPHAWDDVVAPATTDPTDAPAKSAEEPAASRKR